MSVVTNDGKIVVGVLKGFDQRTNVILEDCHERIYSLTEGVTTVPLGLYLIKGDNIALVGQLDEKADAGCDLGATRGKPLDRVVH